VLKHRPMTEPKTYPEAGVRIISGHEPGGRGKRRWSEDFKLRLVEECLTGHSSISDVARRNGVAPNLLYRWRKLALEGGAIAVVGDDSVTSDRTVRDLENKVKELERLLGRKTMEVEILKEALDKSRSKKLTLPALSLPKGGSQ
jgi:transposase-like protein